MTNFALLITCAEGLEKSLMTELDSFGITAQKQGIGRVSVTVNLAQLYQIVLYSRVASRVLLPLAEYHFKKNDSKVNDKKAEDVAQTLYELASQIDWTQVFGVDNRFVVRLSLHKKIHANQQFATLRIKDAVVDCFMQMIGRRPDVDSREPDFVVRAWVNEDSCHIALDLSGTSLHRRGYRVANTEAPLKENLAAALLYACDWHTGVYDALIDPMCGSGTFIIEALLMRAGYPVGLGRTLREYGFAKWRYHDDVLWDETVARATADYHQKLNQMIANPPAVIALDADVKAVKASHRNLVAAGLGELVSTMQLVQSPLSDFGLHVKQSRAKHTFVRPLVIINPPYGERLGNAPTLRATYQGLGLIVKDALIGTQADMGVLGSVIEDLDVLPIQAPKTLSLHNGALAVYFRHGQLAQTHSAGLVLEYQKSVVTLDERDEPVREFINRLQKNLANLKKHVKRTGVTNLRIYDADLPHFNMAVDVYGDWVHVQEYAPPKHIDEAVAKARFNLALYGIRSVLGVDKEQVFIKTRARQSGNQQYTKKTTKKGKRHVVHEDGAYLYVNFTEYLDTGLFIDHRPIRRIIKERARNKRVLNLYAYTCTASVQAALGGARSVVSVDLSPTYLAWGQDNFCLNGFVLDDLKLVDEMQDTDERYRFVAADVFDWLKTHTEQYDLIFIDPPTFSNSKKFFGTFDVQRDHTALINRAMNRLATDGVLYFSNNFSKFVLDDSLRARYDVTDMTHETIGFDFDIKNPIHQSFAIRHKAMQKDLRISSAGRSSDSTAFGNQDKRKDHTVQYQPKQSKPKQSRSQSKSGHLYKDTERHAKGCKDRLGQDKRPSARAKQDSFTKDGLKKDGFKKGCTLPKSTKPASKRVHYKKIDGKLVAVAEIDPSATN